MSCEYPSNASHSAAVRLGAHAASQQNAGANQRPGLQPVHGLEFLETEAAAHRRKIESLAARHAGRAARIRENLHHLQARFGTHAGRTVARQQ